MNDLIKITEEQAEAELRTFRADRALAGAAELVMHVRSIAISGDGERGETLPEWTAPMRITAADDSDAVYAQLLNWVDYWTRELGYRPPALARVAWSNQREAQGFRPSTTPEGASALVSVLVTWLRIRREQIQTHPAAPAYEEDVTAFLGELRGRYALEPRKPRPAAPRACTLCGEFAVQADWYGVDVKDVEVKCSMCGHEVPVASYRRVLEWLPERSA